MRQIVILGLIVSYFGSCTRGPETAITREVKDAGGGDPSVVSRDAMRSWFLQHSKFAEHIVTECRAIKDPPLGWMDTTEGQVCGAAQEAAFYTPAKAYRDNIGW